MGGTRFRLDLNPQNLSMISIAARLWNSQDIKKRIKNNFLQLDWKYREKNWCEISKVVVQNANSINFPASLWAQLKKTILLIGKKIYDWILYVTLTLNIDFTFTEKIYFRFGVVDEIKIFDLYWKDLMAAKNFNYDQYYFRHSPLFSLACIYNDERFVKERKNEMLDELSKFCPEIRTGDEIYNIMSVSICLTAKKSIIENVSSPQGMFEVCLEAGFSKAARFYWEKLDEIQKVSNLTNLAEKCFWQRSAARSDAPSDARRSVEENYCENLLFLINQMGEGEWHLFVTNYAHEIIQLFLPVWPYRELVADLLKYDWSIESIGLQALANFLISFSIKMNRLEFPVDNELVFQIMEKVWGYISVNEKLNFFAYSQFPISGFFLTLNSGILNLIFNDPSITDVHGKKMDFYIKNGFLELVKIGKFDFLKGIIETVFNYIPEPKEFLKEKFCNCDFVRELMENDESFGLLDQFLDWLTESKAERARLKNKINAISVYRSLTRPPYESFKLELAENFLKWRLETAAEIKSFKEEMKSYNFVILGSDLGYVRIKSGDLSWLRPGDSLVMHPDEDPINNADGLTFLKIEDATELNRGVVLGMKTFCSCGDYGILGPESFKILSVDFVGTEVGDFIVFTLRNLWNNFDRCFSSKDKFFELSNAFIKSYYETDEEVLKFRKTKLHVLVTENLIEFLFYGLHSHGYTPRAFFDDFCKFCMISREKIEEIKMQQRGDIEKFLDTYLIDQCDFAFADIYPDWLFGRVKRRELCKKFLNSSNKGALLCVSLFKKFGVVGPEGLSEYKICDWLSLIDDKEKLKNDVFALYENTPQWFPALLDKSVKHKFI